MCTCAHTYTYMKISLDTDALCALVLTVINVEWVGLQCISIISARSVAQRCGNSVKHHRGKQTQANMSAELIL